MYSIVAEPNLLLLTFSGFLCDDEVKRYVADARAAFVRGRLRSGSFSTLIDVSGATIQSQSVVALFGDHIADFPRSERIAVVVGGSLAKMQIRRLMAGRDARLFNTMAEARRWLAAPGHLAA